MSLRFRFMAWAFAAYALGVAAPAFAANATPKVDAQSLATGLPAGQSIVDQNPHLKQYLFEEPPSHIYFGIGLTPITLFKSRVGASFSFFQLHYLRGRVDWEVFNAAFGAALARDSSANSTQFTFRTAPKIRLFRGFSIGPMAGFEFISFSSISARITRDRFFSQFEPFSTNGPIYGIVVSQLIPLGKERFLRINESAYRQRYSVKKAGSGWEYEFQNPTLQGDPERNLIRPSTVFTLEFSLLF